MGPGCPLSDPRGPGLKVQFTAKVSPLEHFQTSSPGQMCEEDREPADGVTWEGPLGSDSHLYVKAKLVCARPGFQERKEHLKVILGRQ